MDINGNINMKKNNEYLIECEHDGAYIPVNEILRLIKLAQEAAIKETVKECTNLSKLKFLAGESGYIDKESAEILMNKLIKDL